MAASFATDLEHSHRCAARLARRSGSSFYRSFALLPRGKRRAMTALYAFARQTDDFGDSPGPPAERERHLQAWRTATACRLSSAAAEVTAGEVTAAEVTAAEDAAALESAMPLAVRTAAADLLPALADSAARYAIPPQHLLEIIDGVIADQHQTRFETIAEVERYCYLVASAVGLACLAIWGHRPTLPRAAAIDCGIAFQWTNILRDIREDAARGRIYLPRECWGGRGLSDADFLAAEPSAALLEVCAELAERARQHYHRGWKIHDHLHPDGRRMFSMMWSSYHSLLERIEADPAAVFRQRVELRHRDRLRILGSHLVGPWFRRLGNPSE
ncbi:phytoene/squalene synthase family protein [Candidatus Laterigemmans baculatus]|uniref:phytoene/squalene synthase family protein n=1 Tax=Candidatus Laterigemmans baculatus TaxID=2770505 RepID=UPI00193B6146|nr:squalene/phytoene synthase family protein [Candidatus Laterigemmans baculatus]